MKASHVVAVPMNTPTVIQEVEVTLLDANHCPGAAMWLFRLRNGKVFLHVGACAWALSLGPSPRARTPAATIVCCV